MAEAAALGEAKVSIRADLTKLDGDMNAAALKIGKVLTGLGRPVRNLGAALTAGLTVPLAAVALKSTLAAARVDELASVNQILGKNAGLAAQDITDATDAVRKQGIEAAVANETIAEFIKANLNISDAAKISRVAQDAAVISGRNSTEVTNDLTEAIITGRMQLFKSAGVLVDLNNYYDKYGEALGKSGRQLTEQEKVQARVNAVLEYGTRIQGAYLAAMEEPGKVLRSYPRYLDDVSIALGESFVPAFKDAIFAGQEFLLKLKDMVSEGGTLYPVIQNIAGSLSDLVTRIIEAVEWFLNLNPAVLESVAQLTAMAAVAGPILLIMGQITLSIGKAIPAFTTLAKALGTTAPALAAAGGPVALFLAALAAIVIGTTVAANAAKRNAEESKKTAAAILVSTESYEEYAAGIRKAAEEQNKMVVGSSNRERADAAFVQTIVLLTEEEWKQQQATAKLNAEWEIRDEVQGKIMARTPEVTGGLDAETQALLEEAEALKQQEIAMSRLDALIAGEFGKNLTDYRIEMSNLQGEISGVRDRIQELIEKKKKQGWLGSKDREELAELKGEFLELSARIRETAEAHEESTARIIYGILAQQIALQGLPFEDTMALLGGVAEKWGLIDDSTREVWDTTSLLIQQYLEGKLTIDEFVAAMEAVKDKSVTLTLKVVGVVPKPGEEFPPIVKKPPPPTEAEGGPVRANTAYIVGEEGYELFIPRVSGTIIPHDKLSGKFTEGGLASSLGNNYVYNYNLTMPTTANASDVRMAFELMQAIGA